MKKQVEIIIFLFFGFAFLVYLFPVIFVEAAKLESGVTINAPSTTETEKICDDTIDNDNDGKIDAADTDCAAAPAGPTAGTCGLQIVRGVPINYGQVNLGQVSEEKRVSFLNVGTVKARIMVKAGDWIGGTSASPIKMDGPGITAVSDMPLMPYTYKSPLYSSVTLGEIEPGETTGVFFQMLATPGLSGSPHQEVTIDLIC